jgi:hypothetical protein
MVLSRAKLGRLIQGTVYLQAPKILNEQPEARTPEDRSESEP